VRVPADAAREPRIASRRRPRREVRPSLSPREALLPYLRLVRAPAVFSALGDPLAGWLIDGDEPSPGPAARLSAASAMLYLAGMALNDLADREEDARERPERPIPSGAVSPRAAAILGGSLLVAGTLLARRCGARWTGPALAATIVAYDFSLKRSSTLGPVAMGACRSLSLLMGVEASQGAVTRRGTEGALLLGAYVAGLTLIARSETGVARSNELRTGAGLVAGALLATGVRGGPASFAWSAAASALAGPAVQRALRTPAPGTIGPAVGALIRAIPALDGSIAGARGSRPAVVLLSLLALTRWGRSLIPIT
jgi:4-hydroxybenzoate polyprenyltransferase